MPGYVETDRKEALKEVRRAYPSYHSIAPEFWSDRKFVEAAIKAHGEAYKYACDEFKKDVAIIGMAIEKMKDYKCRLSFHEFPEEIRNNTDWVRKAMEADSHAFQHATLEVRDNKDFAFEAINGYGWNYDILSDRLKNDKDIVIFAVKTSPYLYETDSISEAMKRDKDVILAATRGQRIDEDMKKALPEFVWTDKDLLIAMTENKTTRLINYLPNEVFNDKQFVEEMLGTGLDHWDASDLMHRVPYEIKSDKDFALYAVSQYANAYSALSPDLKLDRDIARATLEKDIDYIKYVDYVLMPEIDKDIALAAAESGSNHFTTSVMANYWGDEDVALAAVLQDAYSYRQLPDELKQNEGIMLALMTHDARGFTSIPQGCLELSHYNPEIFNNKEFMLEAVKLNHRALNVPSTDMETISLFKDREFMLSVQPYITDNNCCKAFENDKEFILEAVKVRPEAIQLATNNLRFDKDFINQAVANNEEVKKYCEPQMVRPDISYFKAKMEKGKEEPKKEPQTLTDVIAAAKKTAKDRNAEKAENAGKDNRDER